MGSLLLGYDIGSSSIKAALVEVESGRVVGRAVSPDAELAISAPRPGWAEQDPRTWWEHVAAATARLRRASGLDLREVAAIGISYQMHGLVLIDRRGEVLRPAVIWCDSRAVPIGERAFREIGPEVCLERLLNSPGNFTASKLRWVKENEPEIFARAHRALLPGDYIAFRLTGRMCTTPSGLSEAVLWDFTEGGLADLVLEHYGLPAQLIPERVPGFAVQGELTAEAAGLLGLRAGTPVAYRGGDQPNNALSLKVLNPGEIAATAGTSGVVFGVSDRAAADPLSRVNTFLHVNHRPEAPRYGTLLCVNGAGILYSWLKNSLLGPRTGADAYPVLNGLAEEAPVGSGGLVVLPYGNGAERTLENRDLGAAVLGLDFNRHDRRHLVRAALEGIVFAMKYGLEIMAGMGIGVRAVRAGHANLFLSPLFARAFATASGARVELYDTDGAQGAARGAGVGAGVYPGFAEAFLGLQAIRDIEPETGQAEAWSAAYAAWREALASRLQETR